MAEKKITIYHNPRCSKSRQALALLRERGIEPEVVEYLKTPLSAKRVEKLIGLLGIEPHDLLRRREAPYKELGLAPGCSAKAVAKAIAQHPILMERPVVIAGDLAAVGRPPENIFLIL